MREANNGGGACNCTGLLGMLASTSAAIDHNRKRDVRYAALNSDAYSSDAASATVYSHAATNFASTTTATIISAVSYGGDLGDNNNKTKNISDIVADECVARELRRLIWNANRDIWLEWRQRPEYLASGDLYSIVILCLFASIILLLMVRAIKPTQSIDDQVTLLLSSMRVRVEFEDNVRQRRKLREAKLKAVRWLAEAKMRANMRKLSFRRSRSETAYSADVCFAAHPAASPTRSLFASALISQCTVGGSEENGKRGDSSESAKATSSPSSFALSSLISQSLSNAPSIIFPIPSAAFNGSKRPSSPAKSVGAGCDATTHVCRRGAKHAPSLSALHLSMHDIGLSCSCDGESTTLTTSADSAALATRTSWKDGNVPSSPAFSVTPTLTPLLPGGVFLNQSREDLRRLSTSSTMTPSTPASVVSAILRNTAERTLRQKDSWPLCATPHHNSQQFFAPTANIVNTKKDVKCVDRKISVSKNANNNNNSMAHIKHSSLQYHQERARSFHFVPQIVVTPQCDDDNESSEKERGRKNKKSSFTVDQQRLRRQLQQQLDANDNSDNSNAADLTMPLCGGSSGGRTTDDEETFMDDSSRSSSRPFSSSRASSSQSGDDEVSQSSFSQCDVVFEV